MDFRDFVSAVASGMGSRRSTGSYEYEARQRRKRNRIMTIHNEDTDSDITININDIFHMYISKDNKYLIKYKKLGMIRTNRYDYSEIRKRMDERFANIYDIDKRLVIVINTNGITSMNHDAKNNKYTITVGVKNTVYNVPFEYYHAIEGLTDRRKQTVSEMFFGVDMPHWSQIEAKHSQEKYDKVRESKMREELQQMKNRYEEIDKAAEEMQTWGDVCL